jgi:AcrR family transcriptional regulator
MIEGAFQLVRERGHEALSARSLASYLGCSTQPVMYQFPSLDTLRELTYQRADEFHSEYLLKGGDLLEIGLRYIRFAEEEPQLFRFLFQSGHFSGSSLTDLIRAPEAAGVLAAFMQEGLVMGGSVSAKGLAAGERVPNNDGPDIGKPDSKDRPSVKGSTREDGISEQGALPAESMSMEDAASYFELLFAVVHGYASLIANNAMKYDPDAVRKALITVAEGLEKGSNSND